MLQVDPSESKHYGFISVDSANTVKPSLDEIKSVDVKNEKECEILTIENVHSPQNQGDELNCLNQLKEVYADSDADEDHHSE